jgi:hypothetical protein
MLFTKTGNVLAYVGLGVGILFTAYGYWLGAGVPMPSEDFDAFRKHLAATGSKHVTNQGYICILGSIALGILSEISSNMKAYAMNDGRSKDEDT